MSTLLLALVMVLCPAQAGPRFHDVASQIGLTADQEKKADDLVYQANVARVDLRARRERAELEMRRLLSLPTVDEKAVRAALDELNAAEAELRRNRVELFLSLRKLMSQEQWAALEDQWLNRRGGGEEGPPPPPPGD